MEPSPQHTPYATEPPAEVCARLELHVSELVLRRALDAAEPRETDSAARRVAAARQVTAALDRFRLALAQVPLTTTPFPAVWEEILAAAARECPASTSLSTAQLLLWRTLARPDELIESQVGCSFERAHDGPHHAPLGVNEASGELGAGDMWWLRWSDDGEHHEFVAAPFCQASRTAGHGDFCVRPTGHQDAHVWSSDLRTT